MNMEHQQFYKMVQYDVSCRVPLIISSPWTTQSFVTSPTHAIDLFPTIAEMASEKTLPFPAVWCNPEQWRAGRNAVCFDARARATLGVGVAKLAKPRTVP